MRGLIGLAVVVLSAATGCRSHQLAHDQDHMRAAVMCLHENQIMDNLVRARKGLPILQLDYTNMTGTITQTGNLTGGGTQTVASTSYFQIPATALAVSRVVTGVGNLSSTATQVNQLTVTAQPVLNAPEVYNAYLAFLAEDDRLRESPCPPACEEAVIVRCYPADCTPPAKPRWCWWKADERPVVYYWVPRAYEKEFRRLSLYTVAVRGQPQTVSPNFDAVVSGVTKTEEIVAKKVYELWVKIDKKIPNDTGFMSATLNGKFRDGEELTVLVNETPPLKRAQPGALEEGQKTDVVRVTLNIEKLGFGSIDQVEKALAGQKVSIRLKNFQPAGSPTDRLLEDVRSQIELFRLGQFQPAR